MISRVVNFIDFKYVEQKRKRYSLFPWKLLYLLATPVCLQAGMTLNSPSHYFVRNYLKVAPPFRVVELDILFGSGIDTYGCLLDAAENVGVVERKGSWYNKGETRFAQGDKYYILTRVC